MQRSFSKSILAASAVAVALLAFPMTASAGGYGSNDGYNSNSGYNNNNNYNEEPVYKPKKCFYKNVRRVDSYGNYYYKRIKVCTTDY